MAYENLPGVQVNTIDGGLAARRVPTTKSVLILGTAGQGPADTPYQVVDRADAAALFGNDGTLIRAMEEVAGYSDNVFLFRIGTKAATLAKVGATTTDAEGITIALGDRTEGAETAYKIWYDGAGVVYLWNDGNLVYANDNAEGVVVDTGDSLVLGVATAGEALGDKTTKAKTLEGAITVQAAAAVEPAEGNVAPVFTAAVTGLGMTSRATYVAQQLAFDLLENFPVQEVFVPNAVANNPNVAFKDDPAAVADPKTGRNVLDWLKTTQDAEGNAVFHWASDTKDSAGTVTAKQTFTSASDRLGKDYHEVSFEYQLARFAAKQAAVLGGCLGFIGTVGPVGMKFDLPSTRDWIGYLPKADTSGKITAPGKGLLGTTFLTGTTAAKMSSLCHDFTKGYRLPGLFQTASWELDGEVSLDRNQNFIDIGSHIHVVGDYALINNSYIGNIAGCVAGLVSAMDEKASPTNKPLKGVRQLYRTGLGQLDSLTKANINMLRFKRADEPVVLLHGMTAANENSDYTNLLRMRIKFLVMQQLFEEADKFVGQSSADGLQLQAMQTALDKRLGLLQKRGYIQRYKFVISTTDADQRIGRAFIAISFMPADELVQLRAEIAISRT
jgi:hypothetical protein